MTIKNDTQMMLFRFNNYQRYSFIDEHLSVLRKNGCVWMLKIGKRTSLIKIGKVLEEGGWLILRAPKSDGGKSYIAHFSTASEEEPSEDSYPSYYEQLLDNINEDFYDNKPIYQWFKIDSIEEIKDDIVQSIVLSASGKKVEEIINSTRTSVMFVHNQKDILL